MHHEAFVSGLCMVGQHLATEGNGAAARGQAASRSRKQAPGKREEGKGMTWNSLHAANGGSRTTHWRQPRKDLEQHRLCYHVRRRMTNCIPGKCTAKVTKSVKR